MEGVENVQPVLYDRALEGSLQSPHGVLVFAVLGGLFVDPFEGGAQCRVDLLSGSDVEAGHVLVLSADQPHIISNCVGVPVVVALGLIVGSVDLPHECKLFRLRPQLKPRFVAIDSGDPMVHSTGHRHSDERLSLHVGLPLLFVSVHRVEEHVALSTQCNEHLAHELVALLQLVTDILVRAQ